MRGQMQIRINRRSIQIAAVHLAQRPAGRAQPPLMPIECRNAVSLGHAGE